VQDVTHCREPSPLLAVGLDHGPGYVFSLTERDERQTARTVIASSAEVQYYPAVIAAEMVGTEDRIMQEPKTHEQREDSVLPRNLDLMLFPRGGLSLPRSVAMLVTSCRLGKYEVVHWLEDGL
jgi:hypothetical protein